jgi:GWxTD domain-containing protein
MYHDMGLLARGTPMPFIGSVSFLASPNPDSTHVVLAVSIANAALTFARENDRFRAGYTIGVTLRDGATAVRQFEAHESVLIPSFRETSRIDQSVFYQELLTLKPGRYNLTLTVRDDGSSKASTEDVTLAVPTLGPGSMATPMSFLRTAIRTSLDSLPRIVTSPLASITFGRDTVVPLYVEAYGPANGGRLPLLVSARTDNGKVLFTDTISLARRSNLYSGVLNIPVSRIGIGPSMVSFWQPGRPDTSRTPIFVNFGEDLPVASYDEMINYLRWFAAPYKLKALRDTAPEFRAAAWGKFVKENSASIGGNDALHDYFARLVIANARYREEGIPGWTTDRGKVLLALGEPDQVYDQGRTTDLSQRGRVQIWEYRSLNLQLQFYDQTGFNRWRLTNSSEIDFQAVWRRRVQQ